MNTPTTEKLSIARDALIQEMEKAQKMIIQRRDEKILTEGYLQGLNFALNSHIKDEPETTETKQPIYDENYTAEEK